MTAKDLRNKGGFDRGVTREQRAINRRSKLQSPLLSNKSDGPKRAVPKGINRMLKNMRKFQAGVAALADFENKLRAIEEERFGILPDRKNSDISFEEKQFGDRVACGTELCPFSVVSLALFDGETMLFACSGIVLPLEFGTVKLTRFLTSACLVREFNEKRNRDDNLKIQVRLPNDKTTYGLLGLYDKDIAIVTSLGDLGLSPVYLNRWRTPDFPDFLLLQAAGRAFKSGCLMAMHGSPCEKSPDIFHSDSQGFTEAALGGPLVGNDRRFHGMIVDLCDDGGGNRKRAKFLSRKFLYERLKLFQMQNPKELRSRDYSLHEGVSSVAPSGFMKTIYRLKSFGYPMPPPLMLEFNARLFNRFEDRFGELRAWKGYPFGDPPQTLECVWMRLKNEVVTKISRSVVSLKSFNGDNVRSFACTGLLIKWHGGTARHTIVLTSASLVRDHHNEDVIDKNLRIEVFLPPNQRSDGTLELYNLHYNIAIISVKKGFNAICPEDIFNKGRQKFSEKVLAIGRDTIHGLLMGTIGEVRKFSNKDCKLKYADLNWSTCKIKKAGIGGPLVDFEGTFVGMNFYDESSATPFLSRRKVVSALKGRENFELPSKRGDNPMPIKDGGRGGKQNRWPVPKPYWFHGALDEDTDEDMDEETDEDTDDDPELTGGIQKTP